MKKCQTCIYFPCTKFQCNIGNKEGCENYESIVTKTIKSLEKCENKKEKWLEKGEKVEELKMNKDEYGEIINGDKTFKEIARLLNYGHDVIVGWTDENCTHYDILFCLNVAKEGPLQGGLQWNDLFVSVMRKGCFGFLTNGEKNSGYVAEKLGLVNNITTEKLTELINEIIKNLKF